MEGTEIRPGKGEKGILWEVVYKVESDERCQPLAFALGFRSKLPACVLLQPVRALLTSLTLIVATTFFFFFPLGNVFHLLRTKIFFFRANKFKKNPLHVCVCGKDKNFLLSRASFFSGLWQFPVHFLPSSQGLFSTVLSHQRHEALCFAPGSFFKAPWECCGRLLGANLECSSRISLGLYSLGCCRLFLSVSLVS